MDNFIIKRDLYLDKLIRRMHNNLIKIIIGPRRCGKSFLLNVLFYDYLISQGINDEQIIRLSLDSDSNRIYRDIDNLSKYLFSKIVNKNTNYYFLLDEVQFAISDEEIKNKKPLRLYSILNELLTYPNVDVYISGSNSRFLSSDVATEFRGRGDVISIYPLSFLEFYNAYKNKDKYEAFLQYSTFGGMPMILKINKDEDKIDYLNNLIKITYINDIIERHNLRDDNVMDTLIKLLASSIGSLNNPLKISNTFKTNNINVSDITISTYIDYLIDSFLIEKVHRYDIKKRRYINSPYKFYFKDLGIRNALLNFRQQEQTHILENIIYNELIIRGFNVDVGIVNSAITNANNKKEIKHLEIDFIANRGYLRYYIQSAYSIPDLDKLNQEIQGFNKINDSFKKIIITQDLIKAYRNDKGYLIINIIDFLLNPNSLEW